MLNLAFLDSNEVLKVLFYLPHEPDGFLKHVQIKHEVHFQNLVS